MNPRATLVRGGDAPWSLRLDTPHGSWTRPTPQAEAEEFARAYLAERVTPSFRPKLRHGVLLHAFLVTRTLGDQASVRDVAGALGVTTVTARKHLQALAVQGVVFLVRDKDGIQVLPGEPLCVYEWA